MKVFLANIGTYASVLGLILTIILTFFAYQLGDSDHRILTLTFAGGLVAMSAIIVINEKITSNRTADYIQLKSQKENLQAQNLKKELDFKSTSETLSDLTYYNELIWFKLDQFNELAKEKSVTANEMVLLCDDIFDYFMAFTACLQSYYSNLTNDKCAITIKLLTQQNGRNQIKTFFRDPISYPKRSLNDKNDDGSVYAYSAELNTGFDAILNSKLINSNFCHENLRDDPNYKNANKNNFRLFYNATIIEPITIKKHKKYIIKGFLCVDNMSGQFKRAGLQYSLECSAMQLCSIFKKFESINEYLQKNNIEYDHDIKTAYFNWG